MPRDWTALVEFDKNARPQGNHAKLSAELCQLAEDMASSLVLGHMSQTGVGDADALKKHGKPPQVNLTRRLIEDLSVVYGGSPVSRRLFDGESGELLEDDNDQQLVLEEALEESQYAEAWVEIDGLRNLQRQCLVMFAEGDGAVSIHPYQPHQMMREFDPGAQTDVTRDRQFALLVVDHADDQNQIWQHWYPDAEGWSMLMVNGEGLELEDSAQPYGPSGVTPFSRPPALMVYDKFTDRAWLPIPESRINNALMINAALAELDFLVYTQAHSMIYVTGVSPNKAPKRLNPNDVIAIGEADGRVGAVAMNAQIAASIDALDMRVRLFAVSEALPAENYSKNQNPLTGDALIAAERALGRRRRKQVALVRPTERRAFNAFRMVHNTFASFWGVERLDERLRIHAQVGTQWQPKNEREQQDLLVRDMQLGAASVIDYIQARRGHIPRSEAIALYERIKEDREDYPVPSNPGAQTDGPNTPAGEGSATPLDDEPIPPQANTTEGASITAGALRAIE